MKQQGSTFLFLLISLKLALPTQLFGHGTFDSAKNNEQSQFSDNDTKAIAESLNINPSLAQALELNKDTLKELCEDVESKTPQRITDKKEQEAVKVACAVKGIKSKNDKNPQGDSGSGSGSGGGSGGGGGGQQQAGGGAGGGGGQQQSGAEGGGAKPTEFPSLTPTGSLDKMLGSLPKPYKDPSYSELYDVYGPGRLINMTTGKPSTATQKSGGTPDILDLVRNPEPKSPLTKESDIPL